MTTLAQNKAALVAAHRAGDEEAMRRLSQERERLKKRVARRCADCGKPVRRINQRCRPCYVRARWYHQAIASVFVVLCCCAATNAPSVIRQKLVTKPKLVTVLPRSPRLANVATLSWAPVTNAIWYRVYYGQDPSQWWAFAQTTNTSVTLTNMPNGGTECFALSSAVQTANGGWLESAQSPVSYFTWPWQPVGLTIVTAQPQVTYDLGFTWQDYGPALVWTNPAYPTMLLRLNVGVTNL